MRPLCKKIKGWTKNQRGTDREPVRWRQKKKQVDNNEVEQIHNKQKNKKKSEHHESIRNMNPTIYKIHFFWFHFGKNSKNCFFYIER